MAWAGWRVLTFLFIICDFSLGREYGHRANEGWRCVADDGCGGYDRDRVFALINSALLIRDRHAHQDGYLALDMSWQQRILQTRSAVHVQVVDVSRLTPDHVPTTDPSQDGTLDEPFQIILGVLDTGRYSI
jgi:hypothetical protein